MPIDRRLFLQRVGAASGASFLGSTLGWAKGGGQVDEPDMPAGLLPSPEASGISHIRLECQTGASHHRSAYGDWGAGFPGRQQDWVSSDGRLFVAEPNNRILVFAPGANGNVPPSQAIQDSTITGLIDQGGIGLLSCNCQ